jgi:thioredoxin 1
MEPIILYFSANWCGHCRMLSPKIDKIKAQGINVIKLNTSEDIHFQKRYKIESIPTCIKIDSKGKELKRHIGDFKNIEEIKKWYYE